VISQVLLRQKQPNSRGGCFFSGGLRSISKPDEMVLQLVSLLAVDLE
jgi:hypothetical protein